MDSRMDDPEAAAKAMVEDALAEDVGTSCRHCGATGLDPADPKAACAQCEGTGLVVLGEANPVGPGVDRLVAAARAHAPKNVTQGPAMMILWEKCKGRAALVLIDKLRQYQPQRNRKERKAYDAACKRAVMMGILVKVPAAPKKDPE